MGFGCDIVKKKYGFRCFDFCLSCFLLECRCFMVLKETVVFACCMCFCYSLLLFAFILFHIIYSKIMITFHLLV